MQYYLPIEINHDWYKSFILKSYGYQCCKTISIQLIDIKKWLLYWIVNISFIYRYQESPQLATKWPKAMMSFTISMCNVLRSCDSGKSMFNSSNSYWHFLTRWHRVRVWILFMLSMCPMSIWLQLNTWKM